jgi:hypothetical protein
MYVVCMYVGRGGEGSGCLRMMVNIVVVLVCKFVKEDVRG